MDGLVCLSPHLDDAALSAGQFLVTWPGAYVLSLFCGLPSEPRVTTFDVNSGFRDSTDALIGRAHEDDRAMYALGTRALRAAYVDNQYRMLDEKPEGHLRLRDALAQTIRDVVDGVAATRLIGPLGLVHPDHVLVGDALLAVIPEVRCPVWLYEDIPTRVLDPGAVVARLAVVAEKGLTVTLDSPGTGDMSAKKRAVGCYESQSWALDEHVLYAPERYWRVL